MKNNQILQALGFIKTIKRNYWCNPRVRADICKQNGFWVYRMHCGDSYSTRRLTDLIYYLIKFERVNCIENK